MRDDAAITNILPIIREVIVVEGKDDVAAVRRACQAQTIITRGLGITQGIIENIKRAQARCGVIVLTDPDGPGEKIRQIIQQAVPGCKHAYIYRDRKAKYGPVGVEYASPEAIRQALADAKATLQEAGPATFTVNDLLDFGLIGHSAAQARRDQLGQMLGIGQTNAKQFLKRINGYGITMQEMMTSLQKLTPIAEKTGKVGEDG